MPIFPTLLDQFNSNQKIEMFIQSIFELSTRESLGETPGGCGGALCVLMITAAVRPRDNVSFRTLQPLGTQCHRNPYWPVPVFYVLIGTTAKFLRGTLLYFFFFFFFLYIS